MLAGCATWNTTSLNNNAAQFQAPVVGDAGVVVAESRLVQGISNGTTVQGKTDDCMGPGLGIKVNSTTQGENFLFDSSGEECEPAQIVFNGSNPLDSRPADPFINVSFHDSIEGAGKLSSHLSGAEGEGFAGLEPSAGPTTTTLKTTMGGQDQTPELKTAITRWKLQDELTASRSAEANAAAEREIERLSKNGDSKQNVADILAAQLREKERLLMQERQRQVDMLDRSRQNRELTESAQENWKQKENELQSQLNAAQKRMAMYKELADRMAQEQNLKEESYQKKILALKDDLKASQTQADAYRQNLVLKAAAKIAEAEQMAKFAQLQDQDSRLREAARLKAEAEEAMDKALALKTDQLLVGKPSSPVAPLALMATPVVIQAKDLTLEELLSLVLKQAAPQAGEWKADWQLSGRNKYLLKEKWSLTAEADVKDVLEQIKAKLKQDHKVNITFAQFNQSRLLVATDGQ